MWTMSLFTDLFTGDDEPDVAPAPVDLLTEGKLGVVKLTPIVDSLLAIAIAIEHAAEDGFSLGDGLDLVKPTMKAAKAFKHYKTAKDEALDVTPYEASILADRIATSLGGLHNAKAARIATIIAQMAPDFLDLLAAVQDLRNPAPPVVDPPRAEIVPE